MAAALASSPLVHLTTSRLRLPRPQASASSSGPVCSIGVCLGWRLKVGWRALRRRDRLRCFSTDGGGGEEGEKRGEEETSATAAASPASVPAETQVGAGEELASERSRSGSFSSSSSSSGVTTKCTMDQPLHCLRWSNIHLHRVCLLFCFWWEALFISMGRVAVGVGLIVNEL
ncbi:putative zinc metalloprotease EGY1 chloroplastic [Zea mays]|uniref:Putative zinc metalloprotease EGY1 chloroplastic n=1 Tax=Zea mays TaxID=4577 RepID=A0A1D6L7B4_MAIZE|nr:putative zinc metalloprotease EGY1 chloroplastic [Zea mays]